MADKDTNFNSSLGKYFCKLRLAEYKRPKPFDNARTEFTKTIILPLPMELRDDTMVNYSNQDLQTVGDVINGAYSGAVGSLALSKAGEVISGGISQVGGAAIGALVGGGAGESSSRSILADKLGATVQDQLGNIFPADQIASAVQQGTGMAPNPNPSVSFAGPHLREFVYSWTLYPKNKTQSDNLEYIIKLLKSAALPENVMQGAASVLRYPKMCQVNFYPWDDGSTNEWGWTDKSIIKHKKAFLGAVNVSYTPANPPAFFYDNRPVAVQLTISFKEIEYFMSHDWGGVEGTGGLFEDVFGSIGSFAIDQVGQIVDATGISDQFNNLAETVFGGSTDNPTDAAENG